MPTPKLKPTHELVQQYSIAATIGDSSPYLRQTGDPLLLRLLSGQVNLKEN